MKKKIIYSLFITTMVLNACKPDIKGELGATESKVDGMVGTWEVSSFIQQDPNNPIQEERDLSEFYVIPGETPLQITFAKADSAYNVQPGPGRNYFGSQGKWWLDDPNFPTYLYLQESNDSIINQLPLGNVVRPSDNRLSIDLESACSSVGGDRTVTSIYKFTFTRK
ncbi:MAG: DUF5004 domain-containing protein [Flavobacteriales bacterium]